jgi:hypothetical protein
MPWNESERLQEDDPANGLNRIPHVENRMGPSENVKVEMFEPIQWITPFQRGRFESLLNVAEGGSIFLPPADSLGGFSPVA